METALIVKESELFPTELADEVAALCQAASTLPVEDADTYQKAAQVRKAIKDAAKKLDTRRKEHTAPLDVEKKAIIALFQRPLDMLGASETTIGGKLMAYDREQQRIRDEEQRRINEMLREKAEAEKAAAEKAALAAIKAGNDGLAERIVATIAVINPVEMVLEAPKPQAQGVHYRELWSCEIVDPALVPNEFKIVDESKLKRYAVAMKEQAAVPGVRFFFTKQIVQR